MEKGKSCGTTSSKGTANTRSYFETYKRYSRVDDGSKKKNIGLITFLMAALKLIKDAMNKSFKIWVSKAVKRGAKRP